MIRIYYAAPLHKEEDQKRNAEYVSLLREEGYLVYLPQEAGVWEDLVNEELKGRQELDFEQAARIVRADLYVADKRAIDNCDIVVAYFGDRPPSEGGLWEMGYAVGRGKPVVLFNPHNWRFNLMPEYGSSMRTAWREVLDVVEDMHCNKEKLMKGWYK